jgi:plasmid stabilization system protein ParE
VEIRFRGEAAEDVVATKIWYNERVKGLGEEFEEALKDVVGVISRHPEAFPEIAAAHRRALLSRFPYALYYRVQGESIEVVACLHQRRSPTRWRGGE